MLLPVALPLSLLPLAVAGAAPNDPARVPITVRETAGLRRFGFPVTAAVPFPRGTFTDARHARLVDAQGKEVPAQITVTAQWPDDRSLQWVDVDFHPSPAP